MNLFVCTAGPRPFDSAKVIHVAFEDKSLITNSFVQHIFNGIGSISLILQAQKATSIISQKESYLSLDTFSFLHSTLI